MVTNTVTMRNALRHWFIHSNSSRSSANFRLQKRTQAK